MPVSVNHQFVIVYYKTGENGQPASPVHESRKIENVSFPARVSIQNHAPKNIAWDYAVIQERYYREN